VARVGGRAGLGSISTADGYGGLETVGRVHMKEGLGTISRAVWGGG
jgi:hypothetical protein